MNKKEMAGKLAKKTGLSGAQALEVINTIFDTAPGHGIIAVELDAGRKVQLPGFGTFLTKRRPARQGRNPQTGEKMTIRARTVPVFRPGKGLKDRVFE